MCTECRELYPDGDGLEFCSKPLPLGSAYTCGGLLKTVKCLVCEDKGTVQIHDPRIDVQTIACPRGCHA